MSFRDYIKGIRKGKDARRIEIDSMYDSFLEEAIEGYDSVKGDHIGRLTRMQAQIEERSASKKYNKLWFTIPSAAAVVILAFYFILMDKPASISEDVLLVYIPENYVERMQVSAEEVTPIVEIKNLDDLSPTSEIDVYIPEEYVEKKKNVLNKEEVNVIAVISNLDEVLAPDEPINIYVPKAHLKKDKRKIQSQY